MPVSRTLALEARDLQRHPEARLSARDVVDRLRTRSAGSRRRGRKTVAALTLATALTLGSASTVDAASGFCSETGDFCTSATKTKGVRQLWIGTFAHRGSVDICVKAAGDGEAVCKSRKLREKKSLYSASVKWSTNYPREPKGKRTVTFSIDGSQIGPALTFNAG